MAMVVWFHASPPYVGGEIVGSWLGGEFGYQLGGWAAGVIFDLTY